MIQDVKFQGLNHSPSDYEAQDGELGTCLNLLNEDGALKPISQPEVAESFTLPNDTCSIKHVHKVTHGNETHSHYIVNCTNGSPCSWYWTEKGGDGTTNEIDLGGFKVNAVTAVGNILCFVGDDSVAYAFWKQQSYVIFSINDLKYSLKIKHDSIRTLVTVELGDDFTNCFHCYSWGQDTDASLSVSGIDANQIATTRSFMESGVNKLIESQSSHSHKHVVFGVAALRLYDGTHINVSNIFPIYPQSLDNELNFDATTKKMSFYASTTTPQVSVGMDTSSIDDFIQGIDIYVTNGESFLDNKSSYDKITNAEKYDNIASIKKGTISLYWQNAVETSKTIDSLVFYHSLFIDKNNFDTFLFIERPLRTEESISLADFKRSSYGGACSTTYNNRLHIANVTNGKVDEFSFFPSNIYKIESDYSGGSFGRQLKVLGYYPDLQKDGEDYDRNGTVVEMLAKVQTSNQTEYFYGKCSYPLPSIFMFPKNNCTSAIIYMKYGDEYFKKSVSLINSDSFGMSYFVTFDANGCLRNLQVYDKTEYDGEKYDNGLWEKSSEAEYESAISEYISFDSRTNYPSLVKVSEAENPLVFSAKDSVQVGSSIIKTLAANTRPISEGQFGDAPLYAFTDEGVWVLMLGSEGTYMARQPVNRDICTNTDGILQIDDAVLYPTERGIMMQQGRSSICISDALDGYPFDFTQMPSASSVLNVGGISSQDIKYTRFRNFLEGASMIYDYYDNRIIVFNPSYSYSYVYSLKSKMWGMMQGDFAKRVNIYPESYAVNGSNQIVNVYSKNPVADVPYFLCSRPISLGGNDVYKTMHSCIARGYFRDTAKGKCGLVLYGSNDLFHWFVVKTSAHKCLRGMAGSPYKYFRIAIVGSLSVDESISGLSAEFQERWQNKLR